MATKSTRDAKRIQKARTSNMARLDPLVKRMYADYLHGLTLAEVAAKHCPEAKHGQARVHHLFKKRGLKCRRVLTPKAVQKAATSRRARLDALGPQMHADYMQPLPMTVVARKYGTDKGTVRFVFRRLGLAIRPAKEIARQPNGSPMRYVPMTDEQIDAAIASCTKIKVPTELKFEWRRWAADRRSWFIRRMRAKLQPAKSAPTTPHSTNVEPFDYASPRAHEIAARMNVGKSSREHACDIRISSQGVIYRERLYFWAQKAGFEFGAYYAGQWIPGVGRPALHQVIWQEHNRPLRRGEVVRHADGNRNNFDPANLVLLSRNELARENQAIGLTKKSRALTALLLARSQHKTPHELSIVQSLRHQKHR